MKYGILLPGLTFLAFQCERALSLCRQGSGRLHSEYLGPFRTWNEP